MVTSSPDKEDAVAGQPGAPPPPPAQPIPPASSSLPPSSQRPDLYSSLPPLPSKQQQHYPWEPQISTMVTSSPDKDDDVAGQLGAPPPAQPIPPASPSSLPPLPSQVQQHYPRERQIYPDLSIPELNNNHAIDASLFDFISYLSVAPLPHAAPTAPLVQPAIPPPPPEMQPPMQMQHYCSQLPMQTQHYCSQQPPAMATMQGSQHHGYLGAAPAHVAAHYAVLPDVLPPPDAPAKSATGRRRGRPPGGAAKSKPKRKPAKTAAAAATPDQERQTDQQQAATMAWLAADDEVVQYADTSPPGVRFTPTDPEIIGYLRRKYLGRRMPVGFIKEFNVFEGHPSTIQEKCGDSIDGAWYVFTPRHRKYMNGFRPNRSVGDVGYWKSNTVETAVEFNGNEIGRVNSLTFHLGPQPKGTPTPWKMKEYRIKEHRLNPNPLSMLLDQWVICKLFLKDTQHDAPVQDQTDEGGEHADSANGSGGEDNVDGNQPPNDQEHELGIEDFLALDDFEHGDPGDQ